MQDTIWVLCCHSLSGFRVKCAPPAWLRTVSREVNLNVLQMRSSGHLVATNANLLWRIESPLGLRRISQKQKQTELMIVKARDRECHLAWTVSHAHIPTHHTSSILCA